MNNQLFDNSMSNLEVGEIADIYEDGERCNINYDHCDGCPLQGNPKVWNWRGDCDSKLCIVGMNPGAKEKDYKFPFVGPSGAKLEKRLVEKMGLGRKRRPFGPRKLFKSGDFYLTNVVKCWTANNGNPTSEAIRHCWNHLESELEGREVIVPLGKLAQKAFQQYYNGPAIIHNMTHPSAACRKGIYDARLISEVEELLDIIKE